MKNTIKYNLDEIIANYSDNELENLDWNFELRGRFATSAFSMGPGKVDYREGKGIHYFLNELCDSFNDILQQWLSSEGDSIKEEMNVTEITEYYLDIYGKVRLGDEFFTISDYIANEEELLNDSIFEERM